MRGRTTLWMFAAACAVGAVLWLLEQRAVKPTVLGEEGERLFAGIEFDAVDLLLIEHGDVRIEARKEHETWQLSQPVSGRADTARISELLNTLEGALRVETISHAQQERRELTLTDFGLNPPGIRVVLGSPSQRAVMLLGRDTAVGDELYACSEAAKDVYVVTRDVRNVIPARVDDLRDRRLLGGLASDVGVLEISGRGAPFVRLQRTGQQWRVTQPLDCRADEAAVTRLLQVLFAAGVTEFVRTAEGLDPMHADSALWGGPYGLTKEDAGLAIRVRRDPKDPGQTVRFGASPSDEPGLIYALRPEERMIATVPAGVLSALDVDLSQLRSRRLFNVSAQEVTALSMACGEHRIGLSRSEKSAWALTQPVLDRADQGVVSALIERLVSLKATSFVAPDDTNAAFVASAGISTCTVAFVAASATTTVTFAHTPGELLASVSLEGDPTLYRVSLAPLPELTNGLPDALLFRDKAILSLPRDEIRSITVERQGRTEPEVAELREEGGWRTPAPLPSLLDERVLEEFLFLFSNLRASRVESLAVRDPAAYGMKEPFCQISLGLQGSGGLGKVLMLGRLTESGERYAMVRGWDVLFVVGRDALEVLALPLVRRPPAADATAVERDAPVATAPGR